MSQEPRRRSPLSGLLLHSGPDPLRNTVLGIFLLILLACMVMLATSLLGLARMQRISQSTQDAMQALLSLEQLRAGQRDVELPELEGRDALEKALSGQNREEQARALDGYEQSALRAMLDAEEQRARQLRIQVIAAGVLIFGTLLGLIGLLYWLFGVLLKPIEDLAGLARRVREGELSWRAAPFTQPELNELGLALNDMLETLEQRLQELDRQRGDWEALVGSIPDAWLGLDPDGSVRLANPAARELAGEDWTGRKLQDLPLETSHEDRWVLTRPDGRKVGLRAKRVDLEGERALLHLRDLEAEERLESLRQEAVSMVLQELRGPSRRLVELSEGYGEVASQARYLRGLVHNLGLSEALRHGRWTTRTLAVELDALLEEVVQSLSGLAREREVELKLQVEEVRLAADPDQLGLLLSTLLRRLIEGTATGGKVSLTARTHQGSVWLELSAQESSLVSELRQWINRPGAQEGDGSGVLRQILKCHEGYLENEPGERLRIELPLRDVQQLPTVTAVEPDQAAPERPRVRVGCWIEDPTLAGWLHRSLRKDFEVCGPETEGLEVHILDLDHPPEQPPRGLILALAEDPAERIERFVELQATALLDKDSSAGELRAALLKVQSGATVLSSKAAQGLRLHASKQRREAPSAYGELTSREQEIFRSITQGLSNKEIAELLVISEGTVKTHVNNLLRKLNLKDRVQLILYATQHDLLTQ